MYLNLGNHKPEDSASHHVEPDNEGNTGESRAKSGDKSCQDDSVWAPSSGLTQEFFT